MQPWEVMETTVVVVVLGVVGVQEMIWEAQGALEVVEEVTLVEA